MAFSLSNTRNFLFLVNYPIPALLFLVLIGHNQITCNSRTHNPENQCPPSSCGNIPKISYPFRLKTDPKNCGNQDYELTCDNNSTTILYLDSVKYHVQSINYHNLTIRLTNAADVLDNNCSFIPPQYFPLLSFYKDYYFDSPKPYLPVGPQEYQSLTFLNCRSSISSPLYIRIAPTCNTNVVNNFNSPSHYNYSYVIVGHTHVSELVDSCRVQQIYVTSLLPTGDVHNVASYEYIRDSMVYGFELSWQQACCFGDPRCDFDYDVQKLVYCYRYDRIVSVDGLLYSIFLAVRAIYDAVAYHDYGLGGLYNIHPALGYPIGFLSSLFFISVLCHIASFFCGPPCLAVFLIYKWRRRHLSMYDTIEEFLQSDDSFLPIRYSYSDVKKMTKGFRDKIGEGGYACVYKGKLRSGRIVAVKMLLGKSKNSGQDFINEVATIGRVHHTNVVRLVGYCAKQSKRMLIYEFMSNVSLDKHLFSQEGIERIASDKMCDISLGVARGIEYLHQGCATQILHFDIKPHNILLDEEFNPKVSDFGLAKSCPRTGNSTVSLTAARGTLGYMAPELFYKNIGGVSHKADVYSFGMLLMEMAGRRKNLMAHAEKSSQIYFPTWVYDQVNEGKEIDLGDASESERKTVKKMIVVALWCIQLKPANRPSMHQVVKMLEADVESLKMPPKPSLWPQRDAPKQSNT